MKKILLAILILIIAAIGGWYLVESQGCKQMNWNNEFCIDDLPKFPNSIESFSLDHFSQKNWTRECKDFNGLEACSIYIRVNYYDPNENIAVHVGPLLFGDQDEANHYEEFLKTKGYEGEMIAPGVKKFEAQTLSGRNRENKIFWRTSEKNIDFIGIQFYSYELRDDGSQLPKSMDSDLSNEVVQFFLKEYPPLAQ